MFSQVDRSVERSTGPASGSGWPLVKGLVEMHHGTVAAASEGRGQGHYVHRHPAGGGGPHRSRGRGTGDRRQCPEPVAGCSSWTSRQPGRGGSRWPRCSCCWATRFARPTTGVEAIEATRGFRPGVILMDVGMPRLNGLPDATRHIREQLWGKGITNIALTGWGQENDRERSREAGCDSHLVKPVSLDDLERLLTDPGPGGEGARPVRSHTSEPNQRLYSVSSRSGHFWVPHPNDCPGLCPEPTNIATPVRQRPTRWHGGPRPHPRRP